MAAILYHCAAEINDPPAQRAYADAAMSGPVSVTRDTKIDKVSLHTNA